MNDTSETAPKKSSFKGRFWMLFPLFLLVASSTGWLIMVSIAVDDPGFSVESDYYKKASGYDDVIAQQADNERLGWHASLEAFTWRPQQSARLTVLLVDAEKAPLTEAKMQAEVFSVARGKDVQKVVFQHQGKGYYTGDIKRARPGLYEVRVRAEGKALFTEVLRGELVSLAGSKAGVTPN